MRKKCFALVLALIVAVGFGGIDSSASAECYQQSDPRWGSAVYGGWNLSASGCGILATVNAVNYVTGNFIQPQAIAQWAYENNHFNGTYGQGTMRWPFYGNITAAFGNAYGFSISGLQSGTIYDSKIIPHLQSGGAVIVHVPNHFMAINAYNSANGTYLVYDSAAKPERNTTTSGTWLTAAQLQSNSLTVIDWFCLVSATGTPPQTQQYKLMATSVGEGTVHFGNGLKYTTVGQGTYVNFQTTPGSYHHVESVCVGGTYYEVKNNGGDAVYQFYMPYGDVEVVVTFAPNTPEPTPLYVTAAARGQGTVHFGNNVKRVGLEAGRTVFFQTTPDTGYKVTAIDVGGTPVAVQNNGGDYVYNFIMPSVDVVVSVTFGPA